MGLLASPVPVYALAAVNCLAASLLVSRLRFEKPQRPRGTAQVAVILEGLRYIWRNRLILGAISLDLFAVLLGGAVALLTVFAREILGVGPIGLGVMRSAPGAGAVLMATLLAYRPLGRRAGAIMLWCVFGFGVFTMVFGLSRNLPMSVAALLLEHQQSTRGPPKRPRQPGVGSHPGQQRKGGQEHDREQHQP